MAMASDAGIESGSALAVACPGGPGRHFRVQVCDECTPKTWRLAGSYREDAAARAAAERLSQSGLTVRVIEYRALPTAA